MKRSLFQWMDCWSDARYLKYLPVTSDSKEDRGIAYFLLNVAEEKPVSKHAGNASNHLRPDRGGFSQVTALPRFDTERKNSLINGEVTDFRVRRYRLKYHISSVYDTSASYPLEPHFSYLCDLPRLFREWEEIMCMCASGYVCLHIQSTL